MKPANVYVCMYVCVYLYACVPTKAEFIIASRVDRTHIRTRLVKVIIIIKNTPRSRIAVCENARQVLSLLVNVLAEGSLVR